MESSVLFAVVTGVQTVVMAFFALRLAMVTALATKEKATSEQSRIMLESLIDDKTVANQRISVLDQGRLADQESHRQRIAVFDKRVSDMSAQKIIDDKNIILITSERDLAVKKASAFEADLDRANVNLGSANEKVTALENQLQEANKRITVLETKSDS